MSEEISDSVPERTGYGMRDRLLAGVLLVAALGLVYICADVVSNGIITGRFSGLAPELPAGGDDA